MPATAARALTVGVINIRVRSEERALIDQAAVLSGKTRSEFMLEAARHAATDAILNRTLFHLNPAAYASLAALLDAPLQPNDRLARTLRTKAPWE